MPLLASALQRAKRRKAEAAAAREAAAKAAEGAGGGAEGATVDSAAGGDAPSSTAYDAAGSSKDRAAVKGAEGGGAAVAVVAAASSSSSDAPSPPSPHLSLQGSSLSSFDLGVVLGAMSFFLSCSSSSSSSSCPFSFVALFLLFFSLAKKNLEKEGVGGLEKKKNRHGLIREGAARTAPRLGAGLRDQVAVQGAPPPLGAGSSPALGEGRPGEPERGARVRESAGDVPGEC